MTKLKEVLDMEDVNDPVSYRLGTHRTRTPEETLARVIPHMPAMGITRIADVTGLSVSNVGFLIHTGIKRLRTLMGVELGKDA